MSLISDELGQASSKKKEFLGIMEKLIPWSQWVGIVQPHYYKGERGNKPMLRIYVLQHLYNLADDAARNEIIDSTGILFSLQSPLINRMDSQNNSQL